MKTINGALRLLGQATVRHNNNPKLASITYSVLEIDGQTLSNIKASLALSSFLDSSLGEEIVIYLYGSTLIGLTKDKKTHYCNAYKSTFVAAVLLICLTATLVWVLRQELGMIAGLIFCSPWVLTLWFTLRWRHQIGSLRALPNSIGV